MKYEKHLKVWLGMEEQLKKRNELWIQKELLLPMVSG
jgi:hypothetical protein